MLRYVLPAILIVLAAVLAIAPSIPLDHPKVSDWPGQTYATDAPLSGWDDARLRRGSEEPALAFATRASKAINSATYHCDIVEQEQTVTSYIIVKMGLLPQKDLSQGLLHPSLMRCGFCHQRAFILAKVLDQSGVEDAHVLGLVGHVVTAFESDGIEYAVDPDFGVPPFPLEGPGLTERVVAGYTGRVSNDGAFETIKAAYADATDNGRYHGGLSRLEALSEKQAAAAGFVVLMFQRAAVACVVLALIVGAAGWIARNRKRAAKSP